MTKKEMTYEQAISRLEEVVVLLENANTPLDAALSLYEEGVSLLRYCNEKLSNAEQKIKMVELQQTTPNDAGDRNV